MRRMESGEILINGLNKYESMSLKTFQEAGTIQR